MVLKKKNVHRCHQSFPCNVICNSLALLFPTLTSRKHTRKRVEQSAPNPLGWVSQTSAIVMLRVRWFSCCSAIRWKSPQEEGVELRTVSSLPSHWPPSLSVTTERLRHAAHTLRQTVQKASSLPSYASLILSKRQ